jgi:hypothetical protein
MPDTYARAHVVIRLSFLDKSLSPPVALQLSAVPTWPAHQHTDRVGSDVKPLH